MSWWAFKDLEEFKNYTQNVYTNYTPLPNTSLWILKLNKGHTWLYKKEMKLLWYLNLMIFLMNQTQVSLTQHLNNPVHFKCG